MLPMTELATNNQVSETTKISLFFANTGCNPRMTFRPLQHSIMKVEDKDSGMYQDMKGIFEFLKNEIFPAQRT
jgi:hypothetical protein